MQAKDLDDAKVLRVVDRGRSRKLWVPRDGLRWPPPRLVQLCCIVACRIAPDHIWSPWRVETEEWFEGGLEDPVDGGWRICQLCGLSQHVRSVDNTP